MLELQYFYRLILFFNTVLMNQRTLIFIFVANKSDVEIGLVCYNTFLLISMFRYRFSKDLLFSLVKNVF